MANFVTRIPYFQPGHVLHPPDLKNPHNIYYYQYAPYVLVEVMLEALCYYPINLNLGYYYY